MANPISANATDLTHWADRIEGRYDFPDLIRRLVLATSKPDRIEFRAQEGAGFAGWDGETDNSTQSTFVPTGKVYWEMGVGKDPDSKIKSDYEKRTKQVAEGELANSTFIFCTPRLWAGKETWVQTKKKEAKWKDIRVYDADNLITWLSTATGVHVWLSAKLGKPLEHVQALEPWWLEWSTSTTPQIYSDFYLSGRHEAVQQLLNIQNAEASARVIRSDTTDESLAFIAASFASLSDNEGAKLFSKSIIIEDSSSFRHFSSSPDPLILVIPNPSSAYAINSAITTGHHVLLAVGSDYVQKIDIPVPRLRASMAVEILKKQLPSANARSLAALARRSFMAYRRVTATIPLETPDWVTGESIQDLIPLILAGQWDEQKDGDKKVIESLSNRAYLDVKLILTKWRKVQDAPFRQIGTEWRVNAKEDSWRMISEFVSREDIDHFIENAKYVLLERDPKQDLPPEEQPFASIRHKTRKYSTVLRKGISDTLAMLGALAAANPPITISDRQDVSWQVDRTVRELTGEALKSSELWIDFADQLTNLAEASPNEFLRILEEDLKSSTQSILILWNEQPGLVLSNYEYPHLLWALEHLAWSPEYFTRVALILSKLTEIVPDTNLVNSPFRSLLSFFRLAFPQCGADTKQRDSALDRIRHNNPSVATRLLTALLPGESSFSIRSGPGARSVLWRDWPSEPNRPTRDEYSDSLKVLSGLILDEAQKTPSGWVDLVEHLQNVHQEVFPFMLQALKDYADSSPEGGIKVKLWNALRDFVNRHRSFADANWSLPQDIVDQLASIVGDLTPTSLIDKYSWLFSNHPQLEYLRSDWESNRNVLNELRLEAIRDILENDGTDSLIDFSEIVDTPYEIGRCLFDVDHSDDISHAMIDCLGKDNSSRIMAQSYVKGAIWNLGEEWIISYLTTSILEKFDQDTRVAALICFPLSNNTLDLVSFFDDDTQYSFWRGINCVWSDDANLFNRIMQELIIHKRPRFALDILAMHTYDKKEMLNSNIVYKALNESLIVSFDDDNFRTSPYDAKQLLDYLVEAAQIDRKDILMIEFHYLRMLSINAGRLLLHEELENNPAFFVEAVGYRHGGGDNDKSEEDSKHMEQLSWYLLESWHSVPGMKLAVNLDGQYLKDWIQEVLGLLERTKYRELGLAYIGKMLKWGPAERDGIWPDPVVCEIIEEIADDKVDRDFESSIYNSRGTTSRGPFDGGQQERDLAVHYADYASELVGKWPRVAGIMKKVADWYRYEATSNDQEAERREDELG